MEARHRLSALGGARHTGDTARLASCFIRPLPGLWAPRSGRLCPGRWCRARIAGLCSRLPEHPCTGWPASGSRAPDALFAAAFYALNPYHLLIVYWRSAYAELLAAVLAAAGTALSAADFFARTRAWLSSGAVVEPHAGRSLADERTRGRHDSLLGGWPGGGVGGAEWSWERSWRPLLRTALAIALGAGLASFYLIPAVYETRWINIGEVLSPGVRPQDNFLFTILADPDHNRFNLLVSTVALAEIGVLAFAIWVSRRWWKKHVGTAAPGCPVGAQRDRGGLDQSAVDAAFRLGRRQCGPDVFGEQFALAALAQVPLRATSLPLAAFMNAALAMLLTMAAKRWTSRGLAAAVLLAAVIVAGYRIQPPWWETASDIREMSNALADGTGYEGTDEYVPAGADCLRAGQKSAAGQRRRGSAGSEPDAGVGAKRKSIYGPRCRTAKSDLAPFQLPGVGSRRERQTHQNADHRCHRPDRRSH